MGNIKNFNFNKLDLRVSNSDYWDFFLVTDEAVSGPNTGVTSGDCFVVWYDFNNVSIYPDSATTANTIYSLVSWNDATNSGYTLNTIGLTGIDNGLITFDTTTGDPTNQALLSALTGTTLVISSGDTRMFMNLVTGTTGNYVYPTERIIDPTFTFGDYIQLCGGFYQGYYKLDGQTYQVLPVRVHNAWAAEFWLKPQDTCTPATGTTLNDVYTGNTGFFFYMGTRAENKFWNRFEGVDSGCTSGCTTPSGCTDTLSPWCTIPRETDISIIGDYGFAIPLDPPSVQIELITNPFLIYGRAYDASGGRYTGDSGTILLSATTGSDDDTCCNRNSTDGLGTKTICTYDGNGIPVVKTTEVVTDTRNPFLVYGRAYKGYSGCTCSQCCGSGDGYGGETACSFSGFSSSSTDMNYKIDEIDNALGFRIKDDGSIGYRLLTVTGHCYTTETGERLYTSGVTIQEEYSASGVVSADTWSYITIRYTTNYLDDCQLETAKPRTGKLMFYVNAKLKFVVKEFPEFVARRLNEYKSKQVAVPFNFSLGGGSQGLLESQTFDGLDMADRGLGIEENFAGTFIGGISQFKFNICDLSFPDIVYNYRLDASRYGLS